jgi:hypothetical protein
MIVYRTSFSKNKQNIQQRSADCQWLVGRAIAVDDQPDDHHPGKALLGK